MTKTLTVDGADIIDLIRRDSLELSEAAYGCDVGTGGFNWDDDVLADVPAMKQAVFTESLATPTRTFTGYVNERNIDRGERGTVENQRQLDVELLDLNTLWDDPIFEGSDANRPAETDYARMAWLAATDEMTDMGISVGVMPNTNTKMMDARDYRREHPRLVAEECMEAAEKNCFLYDYGSGIKIYYDKATGTSLSSTAKITTVLDDYDPSSDVFGAIEPKLKKNPDRVYSTVRLDYAGDRHVTVTNATTATNFRPRAIAITDETVKSESVATTKANAYLSRSSTESKVLTGCAVQVPASDVNLIRAGQRIQVKIPHEEFDDWTWVRISRRTVTFAPSSDGRRVVEFYLLTLEFAEDLSPAGYGRTGDGSKEVDTLDLDRYQLRKEDGGGPFGDDPYLTIDPDFDFGALGSTDSSEVARGVEHNVPWAYTPWFLTTTAVGGLTTREAWYPFEITLGDKVTGVRFDVGALSSLYGFATGDDTIVCGVYADDAPTDRGQFTQIGVIGSSGGTVTAEAELLRDASAGVCWFVLAPNWEISGDGLYGGTDVGDPPPNGGGISSPNDATVNVTATVLVE